MTDTEKQLSDAIGPVKTRPGTENQHTRRQRLHSAHHVLAITRDGSSEGGNKVDQQSVESQ